MLFAFTCTSTVHKVLQTLPQSPSAACGSVMQGLPDLLLTCLVAAAVALPVWQWMQQVWLSVSSQSVQLMQILLHFLCINVLIACEYIACEYLSSLGPSRFASPSVYSTVCRAVLLAKNCLVWGSLT